MPNPSQEPAAPSKAQNQDLKDINVLCTFKFKIESKNSDQRCTKDHLPYPNQDQNAKPQSGTFSVLQNPKLWLKGHECSFHLQIQDREPKFGSWLNQRPLTISKQKKYKKPLNQKQNSKTLQPKTKRTQNKKKNSNPNPKAENTKNQKTRMKHPDPNSQICSGPFWALTEPSWACFHK